MLEEVRDHWTWRPGWRVGRSFYTWHLTFANHPSVLALAEAYRPVIAEMPDLTPVPPHWLHLTLQGVGFTDRMPIAELDAIIEATRERLSAVQSFTVELGPAVLDVESIQLPATPAEPLQRLRDVLRLSVSDVWGPNSVPELPELRPHVSLGYWNAAAPAAPLRERLEQADAGTAAVDVTSVDLIMLNRDHQMYEWTTVATVALA